MNARPFVFALLLLALAVAPPAEASFQPQREGPPVARGAHHVATYDVRALLVQERLTELGGEVVRALDSTDQRTDLELARQFRRFARRLEVLRKRLEGLHPPAHLKQVHDRCLLSMGPVVDDLVAISRAARRHELRQAERLARRFVRHSRRFRSARRALIDAIDRSLG